jgi:hypothetical protein
MGMGGRREKEESTRDLMNLGMCPWDNLFDCFY